MEPSLVSTDRSGPVVTVIITFLNAGELLDEAIASVFAQTFGDWNLLLVDDGSSDVSTAIALRYEREHGARVRYLEHRDHQNLGISASRNRGLSEANGRYIAFLDSDDVWLPHKLERQVAMLEEWRDAAMVYGPARLWYSWSGKVEDQDRDFVQNLRVPPDALVPPPLVIARFLENDAITPLPSGLLLRRDVIETVGGFEDSFRGFHDDQVLFTKICLHLPVYVASDCLFLYRQHPSSYCGQFGKTDRKRREHLAFLNWVEAYFQAESVKSEVLWEILRRKLYPYRHPLRHRMARWFHSGKYRLLAVSNRIAATVLPASLYLKIRKIFGRHDS